MGAVEAGRGGRKKKGGRREERVERGELGGGEMEGREGAGAIQAPQALMRVTSARSGG